jgi:hypothetical protein
MIAALYLEGSVDGIVVDLAIGSLQRGTSIAQETDTTNCYRIGG